MLEIQKAWKKKKKSQMQKRRGGGKKERERILNIVPKKLSAGNMRPGGVGKGRLGIPLV